MTEKERKRYLEREWKRRREREREKWRGRERRERGWEVEPSRAKRTNFPKVQTSRKDKERFNRDSTVNASSWDLGDSDGIKKAKRKRKRKRKRSEKRSRIRNLSERFEESRESVRDLWNWKRRWGERGMRLLLVLQKWVEIWESLSISGSPGTLL